MTVLTVPTMGAKSADQKPLVPEPDSHTSVWERYFNKTFYVTQIGRGPPTAEEVRNARKFWCRFFSGTLFMVVFIVALSYLNEFCSTRKLPNVAKSDGQQAAAAATTTVTDDDPFGPSDADALSALMLSAAGSPSDDDLYKRYNGLLKLLGPRPAPVAVTKSARFIHDFSVNVTGVVDVEGRRCFVMPLVRDAVAPPSSLYDLLFKMSSGYYSMDVQKLMGGMRVVKPAVRDLSPYGLYISKDCADYATFRLEKADVASISSTSVAAITDS